MIELTIEQQIKVLELAKKNLKNYCWGICSAIKSSAKELSLNNDDEKIKVVDIIPIFTMQNALIACKRHKMKLPDIEADYKSFWWSTGSKSDKPRYTVINWMIAELKKKL